jgi:hypothetical protein
MNAARIILPLGAFAGSGLIAAGLQKPLMDVPVVGTLMFSEHAPGGATTAWVLVALLVVGAVLLAAKNISWARKGGLVSVLGTGAVIGLLVSIYRSNMAQVMEIADLGNGEIDEGVKKLLEQMKYGAGAYMCAAGIVLQVCVSLLSMFRSVPLVK